MSTGQIDGAAQQAWHALEADQVFESLGSGKDGLESAEALQRLEQYGPNKLSEKKKQGPLVRFLLQFHNVLIYVLLAAAVVTALMQHWVDTGVILAVVVINSLIGFIQEGKAEKALEGIRRMLSLEAVVIRDGKRHKIPAEDLVPGDLVALESGDRVPADMRLTEVRDLKIEESPLTGESEAVEKHSGTVSGDAVVGDRANMAFSGTLVTYGRARGVVIGTGAETEIGRISGMMEEVEAPRTPLLRQIDRFGNWLSIVILGLTAGFFAIGFFFHEYALSELFLAVIGLAVAAIPEGLPAIMTITLALGVQRMARRNSIVRKLPSVETLGSVTVICSDKTGTLTRNEMTVRALRTVDGAFDVTGTGYAPEGEIRRDGDRVEPLEIPVVKELIQGAGLCNDAEVEAEDDEWRLDGEPTDGGLRTLALKAGFDHKAVKRIDALPFESEHKYMATLNESEDGRHRVWVKGAPERLLEDCRAQLTADGEQDLDAEFWEKRIAELAETGQRVLGVAFKQAAAHDSVGHDDIHELVFIGLVGLIDPPREEAIEAVRQCREAGIRVKMITGDHALTASGIARELGMENTDNPVTGAELEKMDEAELRRIVPHRDVFARTSPEHKLRLVEALQAEGEITAMTGDGVNDAPAIKRADVGIGMGIKGTQVTKDAAEMVLADDNFATIAHAVEEGRTIYDNIRKTILFILPTNGAEAMVVMVAILLGIALPITPVQILWVNMITAVTLGLTLAFERTEPGVMQRPPRRPGEPILGPYFVWRIFFVSGVIAGFIFLLYGWFKANGFSVEEGRTVAVNTLVAGELFYLLNCRYIKNTSIRPQLFDNRVMLLAIGLLVLFQLGFTYLPFMNSWFGTMPLPAKDWTWIILAGAAVFFIVEIEKAIARKWAARLR
jgi:Ca2+-transporting ATPase